MPDDLLPSILGGLSQGFNALGESVMWGGGAGNPDVLRAMLARQGDQQSDARRRKEQVAQFIIEAAQNGQMDWGTAQQDLQKLGYPMPQGISGLRSSALKPPQEIKRDVGADIVTYQWTGKDYEEIARAPRWEPKSTAKELATRGSIPSGFEVDPTDATRFRPVPGGPEDPHGGMRAPSGYEWDPDDPTGRSLKAIAGGPRDKSVVGEAETADAGLEKPPTGYEWYANEASDRYALRPIPGGPADKPRVGTARGGKVPGISYEKPPTGYRWADDGYGNTALQPIPGGPADKPLERSAKPPSGYQWDPENAGHLVPIPGGPADRPAAAETGAKAPSGYQFDPENPGHLIPIPGGPADRRVSSYRGKVAGVQYEKPPSGFRWTEGGDLEPIPGGPADKPPAERQADRPPTGYRWTDSGNLEAIPGGPADKQKAGTARTKAERLEYIKPPAGYEWDEGGERLKPIPGGPADRPARSLTTPEKLPSGYQRDAANPERLMPIPGGPADIGPRASKPRFPSGYEPDPDRSGNLRAIPGGPADPATIAALRSKGDTKALSDIGRLKLAHQRGELTDKEYEVEYNAAIKKAQGGEEWGPFVASSYTDPKTGETTPVFIQQRKGTTDYRIIRGGVAPKDTAKPPTEGEMRAAGNWNAAMFADKRMASAGNLRVPFSAGLVSDTAGMTPEMTRYIARIAQSPQQQQAIVHARQYIIALAHGLGGARITEEQFRKLWHTYIPEPGDTDQTVKEKAAMRQNELDSLKVMGGRAVEKLQAEQTRVQPSGKSPARVKSLDEALKLPKGTRFIDPQGVERIR